jgi:hypothetical protein
MAVLIYVSEFLQRIEKMFPKIIFFSWLLAITFMSLVDYSFINVVDVAKGFGSGFWLHVIVYFIGSLLFIIAFGKNDQTILLIALISLFFLGVLFELLQLRIPKRTFNPVDIWANGLGLFVFYVCYNLIRRSRIRYCFRPDKSGRKRPK